MQEIQEQYLVAICEIHTGISMYVLVPNNNDFAILLGHLKPEDYIILAVTPLGRVIDFDKFLAHLQKKNKPDNLNFGVDD